MLRAAFSSLVLAVCLFSVIGDAQQQPAPFFISGRNVNTVGAAPTGPNPFLIGNPQHKQRNEASCDVSPDDALKILCANNDYRGVEVFGDSWIGLAQSRTGGLTWTSRLLEGFPATMGTGIGAADPIVRTVPGLGLVSYITLSRTDDRGTLSLALLTERNNEKGEGWEFFEKRLIGTGTPGRFNDKPAMTAVLTSGTITVGDRQVPRGRLHYAYALFPGNDNNSSSQIYTLYSDDWGLSWSNEKKLSASLGINQGVDLGVFGNVLVATWRQVADTNQGDAIVFSRSTDGGQTWSKPANIWSGNGRMFDQDTAVDQFRTLSMPSMVHDGNAFHVFWSARGFSSSSPDDARIVVSSSRDGRNWSSTPQVIAPLDARGHQIVPQVAAAGGRIQVNWIDTRNNEARAFGRFINDFREDANGNRVPLSATADPADPAFVETFVYRQKADIFGAQASAASANGGAPTLTFSSPAQISRYRFGIVDGVRRALEQSYPNGRMFSRGQVPFNGDYHAVAGQRFRPSETTAGAYIANTAPSTSHAVFYSAFTDNRDVQGYVWLGTPSTSFTPTGTTATATQTAVEQGESGTENVVACTPSTESTPDTDTTSGTTVWTATDSPRSRFQNIYAAASMPGLMVASPSASKPAGTLERAYVVVASNLTQLDRTFTMTIANQPPDASPPGTGRASFRQDDPSVPTEGCSDGAQCRVLVFTIPRASSVARTVYVRSTTARPRITVQVQENGGDNLNGSVILNPSPNVPEVEGDATLPDLLAYELYQPDILPRESTIYYSGVVNPDITPVSINTTQFPRVEYPRVEYPRVEYPRVEYPRVEYPRVEYTAVTYPRVEYPRVEYKSVENPRVEYSAITGDDVADGSVAVTDVTWPVTTDADAGANTTTAMSAKVSVNGTLTNVTGAQLIVSVPQFTTVTRSCDGQPVTLVENQVVYNAVINPADLAPTAGGPNTVNPPVTQPSFYVPPNQVAYVTLRLVGRADEALASRAGIVVRSQPDTTDVDASDDAVDTGAIDTTAPVIDLGSLSAGLTVEGNASGGANAGVTVTATDTGGLATVACSTSGGTTVPTNGTAIFYPIGQTQVNCTATDESGNTSTAGFAVTVADHTAPTLSGVTNLTLNFSYVSGGATVSYSTSSVTSTDIVDSTPTVSCSPASGTFFPLGAGSITCTATDDAGNVTTATRTFTVADTVAPALSLPGPITVTATSAAGATVTYTVTATDAVDATPTVTCSPASGSTFPMGTTAVSCTATDDSGNTSSGSFNVTVSDTIAPSSLTATVTPTFLWPPNGSLTPVTISGQAFDGQSGIAAIEWAVVDEYRQYQPTGSVPEAGNGPFTFQIPLLNERRGNDKDGRHYSITLTAVDRAGNRLVLAQPLIVNIHDQGGN